MTSATTTPARGMGRRHAEGYGLIAFASVLLLVPDDHRGRRSRAMGLGAYGRRENLAA